MNTNRATTSTPADRITQILSRGTELTAYGDYFAALQVFTAVYQTVAPDKYPQGLSSYGLCLSRVEHKNRLGAELCERAMVLQPYDASHRANLVRLYAGTKNRKKAVEVLEKGLSRVRQNARLLYVRDEIGYRKAPSLRFLRRTDPVNKLYSRCARFLTMPVSLSAVKELLRAGWRSLAGFVAGDDESSTPVRRIARA